MRTKKPPIGSTEEQVRFVSTANLKIEPPSTVPMEGQDLRFFEGIIAEFARAEWTAHQLELAALLARTMADLVNEQHLLRQEGSVLDGPRGAVVNPRKLVVGLHTSSILGLRRSLSLHALARDGMPRDVAKRRTVAKQLESNVRNADDGDGLIARPH
jgi:GAF domain-containing protein